MIGDTHGCLEELRELLDAVKYQPGLDRLVFVGDLIDRGPDPLGVLRYVMSVGGESARGNHESSLLESRRPGSKIENSLYSRKAGFAAQLTEQEWDYIEHMPFKIQLSKNIWVVHAGAEPSVPFKDQHPEVLSRVRYVDQYGKFKRGSEWFYRPADGYYWADGWIGDECIIYGHDTKSYVDPQFKIVDGSKGWTLGIDTGCAYGGRLTAVVLDSDDLEGANMEFSQVEAHKPKWVDSYRDRDYKQSYRDYSDFDYQEWNKSQQLSLWEN